MSDENHPARFSLVHQIGELNKTIEVLRAENTELKCRLAAYDFGTEKIMWEEIEKERISRTSSGETE